MVALRDPFDVVHKKDIKNKSGTVVAQVDYVGWSQSADRLDDAGTDWSFSIMAIGADWVHGRLTIGGRHFENIGYAENADMEWKKEPLKDAASDAFKRCAALAGVARYLYDKDAPRQAPSAPQRPPRRLAPVDDLMAPDDDELAELHATPPPGPGLSFKELAELAEARGVPKSTIYQTADRLFGKDTKVTSLTGTDRRHLAHEMGLLA